MGYLENLNYNKITKFLHTRRYQWVIKKINLRNKKINAKNNLIKIVDIGCGHCDVFKELLKTDLNFDYIGIEPKGSLINIAKSNYSNNERFNIIDGLADNVIENLEKVDYFLALETLEHIPEKNVLDIILKIKEKKPKAFLFTVPNEVGPAILIKNLGSFLMSYKRYKEYSFMETLNAGLYKLHKLPPHSDKGDSFMVGHKGFDYRFLIYQIHQHMQINSIGRNPFDWIPTFIAPSVFVECITRNS